MSLELSITNLTGRNLCSVKAERDWRVFQIKASIQVATGIASSLQRLLVGDIELQDSQLLYALPSCDLTVILDDTPKLAWLKKIEEGTDLSEAPQSMQADRDIFLAAIKKLRRHRSNITLMMKQVSAELRADREVVSNAVELCPEVLRYAADNLRADQDIVAAAAKVDIDALRFAAVHLLADQSFMLSLIRHNWRALQFALQPLRADCEVVMTAVQQYGGALEYASLELRSNFIVIQVAMQQTLVALEFVDGKLLAEPEFILAAMKFDAGALAYAATELLEDAQFVSEAMQANDAAPMYFPIKEPTELEGGPAHRIDKVDEGLGDHVCESFDECKFKETLLHGIYAYGFEKPSEVQQRGMNKILERCDATVQARSGTGKTSMCILGCLQLIDVALKLCQAMILAPAESHVRIQKAAMELGFMEGIDCSISTCVPSEARGTDDLLQLILPSGECMRGTANFTGASQAWHMLVATPNSVIELVRAGCLDLREVKIIVVDAADKLIASGFKDEIGRVLKALPLKLQVCATLENAAQETLNFVSGFMRNPFQICVQGPELTLLGTRQFYVDVEQEDWKFEMLLDLYETLTITQAVIFCRTRRRAEHVADKMTKRDFLTSVIHSGLEQLQRDIIMREFRSGSSRVLIKTGDMRDVDIGQVSLIINFDFPRDRETYLRRLGRSGKFGRKGTGISFLTCADFPFVRDVEQFYNTSIAEMPMDIADLI